RATSHRRTCGRTGEPSSVAARQARGRRRGTLGGTMNHSTARRRVGALAVAVLTLIVAAACQPTPDKDAFYTPPSPLGSGTPGTVIRSRASTFTLDPVARTPMPG